MTTYLVRDETARPSEKYGKRPEERTIEELRDFGVVVIDKPSGPTSHQVAAYVQQLLGIDKAGHSGTLDPKVTGVLPVATGQATRLVEYLLKAGKEYVGVMHVHQERPQYELRKAAQEFVGKITQLPPKRSAVARRLRQRTVYAFEFLEVRGRDILFRADVEAGTYIRKLCVSKDTDILTAQGIMPAERFVEQPREVFSLDMHGRIVQKQPSHVQIMSGPAELLEITVSSGVRLLITADHEMLCAREQENIMVAAEDLQIGDWLVKTTNLPFPEQTPIIADLLDDEYYVDQDGIKQRVKNAFLETYGSIREMNRALRIDRKGYLSASRAAIPIRHIKKAGIYEEVKESINTFQTPKGTRITLESLTPEIGYLLGLVAADGNNTNEKGTIRHTRIKFHNTNKALIDTFVNTYRRVFPTVSVQVKNIENRIWEVDTSNSLLASVAHKLGVCSPQKEYDLLPVLHTNKEFVTQFVQGYFDGDGGVECRKKGKGWRVKIALYSISYLNAKRLHQMLFRLGIPSRIRNNQSGLWRTEITELASANAFAQTIGSQHTMKSQVLKHISSLHSGKTISDKQYLPFTYKKYLYSHRKQLSSLGGNLSRVLSKDIPCTRYLYNRARELCPVLPELSDTVIEKVTAIRRVSYTGRVYDMTVPKTHNFFIETGFVSSNCSNYGEHLNVGAHMAELRRTRASHYTEAQAVTLQTLSDAYALAREGDEQAFRALCLPAEDIVKHLKSVVVLDSAVHSLTHGATLKLPGIAKVETGIQPGDSVRVLTLKDELIGIGTARMGSKELLGERGVGVKMDKVLLGQDVYPRME